MKSLLPTSSALLTLAISDVRAAKGFSFGMKNAVSVSRKHGFACCKTSSESSPVRQTVQYLLREQPWLTRTAYAETPPRVVYQLTLLGERLREVLESMGKWGDALPPEVILHETNQGTDGGAASNANSLFPFSQLGKSASMTK